MPPKELIEKIRVIDLLFFFKNYSFSKKWHQIQIKDLTLATHCLTLLYKGLRFITPLRLIAHNEVMIRAKSDLKEPSEAICGIVLPSDKIYSNNIREVLGIFLTKLPEKGIYMYNEAGFLKRVRLADVRITASLRDYIEVIGDFLDKMRIINWNIFGYTEYRPLCQRSYRTL